MADMPLQPLQKIKPEDLDALVAQAEKERWTELILLGPIYRLGDDRERWPEVYRDAPRVFQASEWIGTDGAKALAALTGLTTLDLWGNEIGADGAKALAALTGLTTLDLRNNEIGADGAKALAALTGLTTLDLRSNEIGADGAKALAALTGLTTLDLGNNRIGDDGAKALAALTGLTTLDLGSNGVGTDGAKALAALTGLTSLHLRNNEIGANGAKALAALTGLTTLDLWGNEIGDDGAKALAALTGLTTLDLHGNKIGDDGAKALAALTGLTTLDLGNNRIGTDGAKALAALTGLTTLDLHGNKIGADGAKALAALTGLTTLDLWGNEIGADGAKALAALTGLTTLDLGSNGVGTDGAKALAALTGLTTLGLHGNKIGTDGAKALAALTGLTTLDLRNNGVGTDGAKALAALTGLTTLDLLGNKIGDDGAKALAALTGLTTLHLGSNEIGTDGAKALAALTGLTTLDLGNNGVGTDGAKAIFEAWSERTETDDYRFLDLRANGDLSSIVPREVLSNPTDPKSILAAYRRIVAGDRTPINEAKLLVVGNEAVGKTSLLRYLIHGQPRDPGEEKTPGIANQEKIEVEQWSPEAGGIRLNVWDFGGQEMMRGTHRFFLTSRSLYVLVLEDRREDDRSIYEWLKIIKNRGADSPILVVINKSDEGKEALRLPEAKLREEHPEIIGFLRTSCNDDEFARGTIGALKEKIVGAVVHDDRLKHVRDPFPASYLRVKEAIAKLAAERDVLPLTQFQKICAEGDQEKDQITDEGEQLLLLNLLHDLGTIVAHGRDPGARAARREITLLDPNWLTEAIYKILTSADCAELQGRFNAGHLNSWLDKKKYPKARHEFILDMMQDEEVGLCFALPGDGEPHYLVPEALPAGPTLPPEWPADSLRFRYRYEFLPRGLVPRFIVQAHDLLVNEGARWRTGAVFEVRDCEILVEADVEQDQIDIQVKGPFNRRREALGIIRDRLERVHKQNREAAPTALVPLPDQHERDEEYDFLLTLEDEEGPEYRHRPSGAKRAYTVAELLNGVREERRTRPASSDRTGPAETATEFLNDSSEAPTRRAQETKPNPKAEKKSWSDWLTSWNAKSAYCGAVAAFLFNLLYTGDVSEWRLRIVGSVMIFAITFAIVASRNPERFWRRLIGWFLLAGIGINAAGIAIKASAAGSVGIGSFQWDGSVDPSFNTAWPLIAIALIAFEGVREFKSR